MSPATRRNKAENPPTPSAPLANSSSRRQGASQKWSEYLEAFARLRLGLGRQPPQSISLGRLSKATNKDSD
jgi:hypothetical protein